MSIFLGGRNGHANNTSNSNKTNGRVSCVQREWGGEDVIVVIVMEYELSLVLTCDSVAWWIIECFS